MEIPGMKEDIACLARFVHQAMQSEALQKQLAADPTRCITEAGVAGRPARVLLHMAPVLSGERDFADLPRLSWWSK